MKTVLVTGSSRGIGKEIATLFAKENYNVVLNCKDNFFLMNETVSELKKFNKNIIGIQCDAGNYDSVFKMFEKIEKEFSPVDILINNAGVSYIGLFNEMKEFEWKNIISNNLLSVINCSNVAVKSMIRNKSGIIINISSIWGNIGASCEVIYSATKGAVDSFTKSLAKELGPSNIKVNCISCGVIDTDMNTWLSEDEKKELINEIPLMRFGKAKEVAELCLFLCSSKSDYITGQVITIDGGFI